MLERSERSESSDCREERNLDFVVMSGRRMCFIQLIGILWQEKVVEGKEDAAASCSLSDWI